MLLCTHTITYFRTQRTVTENTKVLNKLGIYVGSKTSTFSYGLAFKVRVFSRFPSCVFAGHKNTPVYSEMELFLQLLPSAAELLLQGELGWFVWGGEGV